MPLAERGVVFDQGSPVTGVHPNRTDIACFIGYVGVRAGATGDNLPASIRRDLREAGWIDSPYARPQARELLNVPVSIDSWPLFDSTFEWDRRPVLRSESEAATALGAAVRSFFAEGGRRCVVVRMGDPDPIGSVISPQGMSDRIAKLIPGYPFLLDASPADRRTWGGLAHLAGIPDVSFVCFPDLAELCADAPPAEVPRQVRLAKPEQWVECSVERPAPRDPRLIAYAAPRSGRVGYGRWSLALSYAIRYLQRYRRDVQLVAAVPRPLEDASIGNVFEFLMSDEGGALSASPDLRRDGISSAFLQLVYPWLRTRWSADEPEGIEPAEGVLLGQLARNALTEGAFRSAARIKPRTVIGLEPSLSRQERLSLLNGVSLQDRVSLFSFTPEGVALVSDCTTSLDANYRPASVNRLVSAIVRAAHQIGGESLFENSGESLWAEIEERMGGLLLRFYELGALEGDTAEEAYSVRCDRSTMTQNDIDDGRLVVEVRFQAAAPIERITVLLAYSETGEVTTVASGGAR